MMTNMTGVGGIGRAGPGAPAARASRGGFRLPESAREATAAAGAQAAAPVGLMALQEADDATSRNRRGAARARGLLKELSALQADLLRGDADPGRLERLALLAEGDTPADPVLADALAGIALRARVELARRGFAARPE